MSTVRTRGRFVRSLATTVALVGASFAVLPSAPAQAAPPENNLQWGMSQYLNEHLTGQTFSNGATEDASTGVVTFTQGTGWHSGGAASIQYIGTARYAFVNGGTEFYSVTFADPKVTVDGSGEGTIVADVSWTITPSTTGSLDNAVVTTFASTGASWTGDVLTGTPRWAGVAAVDEYGTGKPVDGKSWAVPFVKALPSSLNPTFYASGSNPTNDAKKAPAAFVAAATSTPQVTVATTSASSSGLTLKVDGAGFNAATQQGDAGVYVGLAPSGGLPDTSEMSSMSQFAAVDWVMPSQFSSGAWTKSLTAPVSKLDRTKSYSIYTWQAHTHSNTTQDTVTPVTIDWAALTPAAAAPAPVATKATPTVTLDWAKKPVAGKKGKLTVAVAGGAAAPTGQLTLSLEREGTDKVKTLQVTLVNGSARVTLPKLKQGRWTVTVAYAGDSGHTTATSDLKVKVKPRDHAKK
jgi:hypothetical protein